MMDRPLLKTDIGVSNSALAGFILMAAKAAYGARANTDDRRQGEAIIMELLSAARAGGFTQGEILETRLAIGFTKRTIELCHALCDSISPEAWLAAMLRAGFYMERY
jgi:hypothetical protein